MAVSFRDIVFYTAKHRGKSNYFILHKVPVIGSCKMAKCCTGSVASLAHSDILQQHIHQAPHSLWGRLRISRPRGFAVPWLQTREVGARVPNLEGEQAVLPAKGASDSCK